MIFSKIFSNVAFRPWRSLRSLSAFVAVVVVIVVVVTVMIMCREESEVVRGAVLRAYRDVIAAIIIILIIIISWWQSGNQYDGVCRMSQLVAGLVWQWTVDVPAGWQLGSQPAHLQTYVANLSFLPRRWNVNLLWTH